MQLNGFGYAGTRFVDDVKFARKLFLFFLDGFLGFVGAFDSENDFLCGAAGGFVEKDLLFDWRNVDSCGGWKMRAFEVFFGCFLKSEHDGIVEIVFLAPFEAGDGTHYVFDGETANGIFADEGSGTSLKCFKNNVADFGNAAVAVGDDGEGVVESAGENN